MAQENYYLLLEIDPSEKDSSKIEIAIKEKQAIWSKERNHPTKGRLAQKRLDQLKDIRQVMIHDISGREAMAKEAKQLQFHHKKKAQQSLEETIKIIGGDGFIRESQLKDIIEKFKGQFSEKEIREIVLLKLSIKVKNDTPENPKLYIDKAFYKEICNHLMLLKSPDLYSLLGLPWGSSHKQLEEKAKCLYNKNQNANNKTAEVTAKQELFGHCLALFKDQEGVEKYKNTFEEAKFHILDDLIEIANKGGAIPPKVFDSLISKLTQIGISVSDATQYILSYKKRLNLQQCNSCGHTNENEERACSKCGGNLYIGCPKCGYLNSPKNQGCSKCGYSLAYVPEILGLLKEADFAISRGECDNAGKIIKKAQAYCPDFPDIKKRSIEIVRIKKEQQHALANINVEIIERRCFRAEKLLSDLKQTFAGMSSTLDQEGRIRELIDGAKNKFSTGQIYLNSGKTEEAYGYFSAAISTCKDFQEAHLASALCRPAPPVILSASQNLMGVTLIWNASNAGGDISYEITRKTNSDPIPFDAAHSVGKTTGLTFTDKKAIPGEIYYYGVYTKRDQTLSPNPIITGPTMVISNVSDLRVIPGNQSVLLEWEVPRKAIRTEVWRNDQSAPKKRGEGKMLTSVTLKTATDTKLSNGHQYGYFIIAVFNGIDGKPVYSDGVSTLTTPGELPKPITELIVIRKGPEIDISWAAATNSSVQIYNCPENPNYRPGDLLAISDLDKIGKRVPHLGPNAVREKIDGDNLLHLLPVSISGSIVVAGKCILLNWFDDVDELKVSITENELCATWKWPPKAESVLIAFRQDRFPENPNDAKSIRVTLSRGRYDIFGGYRGKVPSSKQIYICVYAINKQGNEEYNSSGCSMGARKFFPISQCCSIKYRISQKSKWFFPSKDYVLTITPSIKTTLPTLILVAKSGGIPLNQKNGTVVLKTPEGAECSPDNPFEMLFTPGAGFPGKWRTRLFLVNEEFYDWLEIEEI
ncbi:MAG: hypothetical protein EXS48_01740 [Candidatus Staskawiczbacteria bacterium]|nr:hypothetical protein [Candidatus Staskawiczbacteria bacterium]